MTLIIEKGDCLKLMKELPDASIDLFICDLPYGETNCGWDSVIDMDKFWEQFRRIRKSKRTACIHFCSTKFGYSLIKSWEDGYKMDMVWKKRNKTGGLQSKHRPMRNHEMVYFFYEQSPKYNRDKYHKRIAVKNETINGAVGNITNAGNPEGASNFSNGKNGKFFEPPNPASVIEQKKNKTIKGKDRKAMGEQSGIYTKENMTFSSFEPPNPASVVEEKDQVYSKKGWKHGGQANSKEYRDNMKAKGLELKYDPPNPSSVMEEKSVYGTDLKELQDFEVKDLSKNHRFDPPNPASVVEETQGQKKAKDWGYEKCSKSFKNNEKVNDGRRMGANYEPPNPVSVMDEPVSMFESTKVFIGKRHHQTEKPQDILEFFLKYWTDEGDTVLDPTMGSGSTGVACKKLNRNFIGFEKDDNIFKVAESRLK
jgi:DNA modification methylase